MDVLTQGFTLTIVGMGLVFLALAIFLVIMVVLNRLFPEREAGARVATVEEADRSLSSPSEAELAVIGAALALWRAALMGRVSDPQLGAGLAASPSAWSIAARDVQRGS